MAKVNNEDQLGPRGPKDAPSSSGSAPVTARYHDTGPVHLDFHRALNGTIRFLRETYGLEVLDETFRRMARDVYRSLRERLHQGDAEALVDHWVRYFEREGGVFRVERTEGEIRLTVESCPAIAYLRRQGLAIDPAFCRQTVVMNEALAEGSPFEIETRILGEGRCVQVIRRKGP